MGLSKVFVSVTTVSSILFLFTFLCRKILKKRIAVNNTENMDNEEKAACNVINVDIENNHEREKNNIRTKNLNSSGEYSDNEQNLEGNLESINIQENCVYKMENIDIEKSLTSSQEIIDEENPANNLENINIEENPMNKFENIEKSLTSSIEIIDEENPACNLESIDIEEKSENKKESIDSEENPSSNQEIIDKETPVNYIKDIKIDENPVKKIENNHIKESLTSGVEIKNPASDFENINIEENIINEIGNTDFEERLTSCIEITNEKNHASNVENSDSEDNWDDIEENCEAEDMIGLDICTCPEEFDAEAKNDISKSIPSHFIDDFKSSLRRFKEIKELFLTTCFNEDYMSSENGQKFMAFMRKVEKSMYFITDKINNWYPNEDITRRDVSSLIRHGFPQVYKELSKVMQYLQKIEEL